MFIRFEYQLANKPSLGRFRNNLVSDRRFDRIDVY